MGVPQEYIEPDNMDDLAIALFKDAGDYKLDLTNTAEEYLDPKHRTYTRVLYIPAGTVLMGKQHKKSCVNIITKGTMIVKSSVEDEGVAIRVPEHSAHVFTSTAGKRKLLYIIEDTVFINVFSNIDAKTLEEVEDELVVPSAKFDEFMKERK